MDDFDGTWPWPPRWFETPDGRMHYVDVGSGPPVVLVHGNPSWGYAFRRVIEPLVDAGHRVIVPDHLGFGRSEPTRARRVSDHARRLAAMLDSLELDRATLVVHDWGGPIALPWAVRRADQIAALALLNTFGHRPARVPLPLRLIRIPGLGELLVKTLHVVARAMLPRTLAPAARRAYLAPHPTAASRSGILALARAYPQEAVIDATALRCPVLVVWGQRDPVLDPAEPARWHRDFPDARLLRLPDAGHFVLEDAYAQVIPAVVSLAGSGSTLPSGLRRNCEWQIEHS